MSAAPRTMPSPPRVVTNVPSDFDEAFVKRILEENAILRARLEDLNPYKELAYRDPLTGLWNRRYVEERLAEECSRLQRRAAQPFAVLSINVNGLEEINDRFGHAAGDRIIAGVGGCLTQTVRTYDSCCRMGGDEFLVILPQAGRGTCEVITNRLRANIAAVHAGHGRTVSVAIGAAFCPEDALTPDEMLDKAQATMMADKRRFRPAV